MQIQENIGTLHLELFLIDFEALTKKNLGICI
jgi:hypothetical protein